MENKDEIKLIDTPDNIMPFDSKDNNSIIKNQGGESMDILFKEIKDDMREREERSERRYKEQQELMISRVEKTLDDKLGDIEKDISDLKSGYWKWGIGIIVSILVAIIGIIPQIIELVLNQPTP